MRELVLDETNKNRTFSYFLTTEDSKPRLQRLPLFVRKLPSETTKFVWLIFICLLNYLSI